MSIELQNFKTLFPAIVKHCDDADLRALLDVMTEQAVAAGEVVIREDDESTNLYFVVDGELATSIASGNADVAMGTLKSGNTFCMANLLDPGPATQTVKAVSDSSLLVLSNESFRTLEGGHLKMTGNILRMLSNNLIDLCRTANKMLFDRNAGVVGDSEVPATSSLQDWAAQVFRKLHG